MMSIHYVRVWLLVSSPDITPFPGSALGTHRFFPTSLPASARLSQDQLLCRCGFSKPHNFPPPSMGSCAMSSSHRSTTPWATVACAPRQAAAWSGTASPTEPRSLFPGCRVGDLIGFLSPGINKPPNAHLPTQGTGSLSLRSAALCATDPAPVMAQDPQILLAGTSSVSPPASGSDLPPQHSE